MFDGLGLWTGFTLVRCYVASSGTGFPGHRDLGASTPTALPPATPKPATGLRTVELDARYRPVFVDGLEYAAIGPGDQLYIVNVETGQIVQVTDGEHPKYEAALSARYVAWVDHRRMIELNDRDTNPPFNYSADIFVLDRATGEEKRITEAPARRVVLEISGQWLAWMDSRNDESGSHSEFDIYAYNLRTGEEIPAAVGPGSQRSPAIHGNTMVWADNRNSPAMGTTKAGCSNCPENRFDIYGLDLTTGEERVLVQSGHLNQAPDINGTHLAWQTNEPGRRAEVRLLDLEGGQVRTMGQGRSFFSGPSLSDRHVVWSTSWPCDVIPVPDTALTGVYAGHLGTGRSAATHRLRGAGCSPLRKHGNRHRILLGRRPDIRRPPGLRAEELVADSRTSLPAFVVELFLSTLPEK